MFLSGDLASSKQFVEKIKQQMPGVLLMADTTDVLDQAQQEQKAGGKTEPLRRHHHRRRPHREGIRQQPELEVLQGHLRGGDPQDPARRRA